jgi:phosphoglycolate phosphatase-like HAD superfamily hydrolase
MSFDPARVRAVLFDLDGTLADTDNAYIARAERLLGPLRGLFPARDPKPFLRWALTTSIAPLNTLMGFPDILGLDDELVHLASWLSDRSDRHGRGHFVLMEGVDALLERLAQRYPLAIVTARPARGTRAFLEQFNLSRRFRAVASAQTAAHTKPYPDPIFWCAEQLGVQPAECVMVGDTAVDPLCGRRAGTQTIGVLCGFGSRAELENAGADLILEHTTQLAGVLGIEG